ncbi:MAG: hypothetical protein ACREH8_21265 [Opitutaceae bacterium]
MPATLSIDDSRASAVRAASAAGFGGMSSPMTPEAVAPEFETVSSAAQNAVATILSLSDRLASTDRQAVNLRFSIGGSDLSVRVGVWGDEVRTTFHTESPELRAALVHEWQSLNAPVGDRSPIRFADPVFSSAAENEQGSASFSSDTASQQQRESASRRETSSAPAEFFAGRVSGRDLTSPAIAAPQRALAPDSSTQRLHTFA